MAACWNGKATSLILIRKTQMKQAFIVCCLVLGVSGFGCKQTTAQAQVILLTPTETYALIQHDSVQVIDVRTPKEFREGHIKNAKNIDFLSASFPDAITVLDKQKPLLVYCRSGSRSDKSINLLLKAGYTNLYHLDGGILKWTADGFKLEPQP